ncbi:MAG TPA: extracellular solute-binding protein [Rhodocyclaceae bacterium]|nr:extracellular solute-binding protein [Rhodocyclaceae bacterium]
MQNRTPVIAYSIDALLRSLTLCVLLVISVGGSPARAAHAYAQFGDIKYPAGFDHFDWVNPNAPKGGELKLVWASPDTDFEKYNPFTLKGSAAPGLISSDPSGYGVLVFESLLTSTMDEPATAYGLLADDVTVAPDHLSATFRLNPKARFQDGSPVLAVDVKYSFDRQTSAEADPKIRMSFSDVLRCVIVGERTVRFDFKQSSAEMPLIAGSLSVFSHKWGAGKPFDQVTTELPIASGPYKIGRVDFGREITYERDPNYWARDLNVRKGMYNFDRIGFRIYKDPTAQTEAFLAGEFDFVQVWISREWARTYVGPKFDKGILVKRLLPKGSAAEFQAFMINTRRNKFKDVRVRRAIGLAMDFEWLNRKLFYNSYKRQNSYFVGTDFVAQGLPGPDELALLEPLRSKLPAAVFTEPVPQPPDTNPPNSLRGNLRKARQLLADAGWTYRDGALRNAKGEAFTIEYIDYDAAFGRFLTPFMQALEKLGIHMEFRVGDYAMIKRRQDAFDYDMTSMALVNSDTPGKELEDRYSSKSAQTQGSYNMSGISNPAIDVLIEKAIEAKTRPELTTILRALDRVLRHGYYIIPNWYLPNFRISYPSGKFAQPNVIPRYIQAESYAMTTWWATSAERH